MTSWLRSPRTPSRRSGGVPARAATRLAVAGALLAGGRWQLSGQPAQEVHDRNVHRAGVGAVGCVGSPADHGERGRAGKPSRISSALARGVVAATDDQGRAADLAEPTGDVVPVHQAPERPGELAEVARRPLRVLLAHFAYPATPRPRPKMMAATISCTGPGPCSSQVWYSCSYPGRLASPGTGLAVDQDQAAHPLRRQQRCAQAEEAALGHAAKHGPLDAEVAEQGQHVPGRVPVAEQARRRATAVAALVPRDPPGTPARARRPGLRTSTDPARTRGSARRPARCRRSPRS